MSVPLPNLESVGGSLDVTGSDCSRGFVCPKIRSVGGNFVVRRTGLAHLPKSLEHIGGNAIVSPSEPSSLVHELQLARRSGILKGKVLCLDDAGNEVPTEAGKPWWKVW